MGSSGESAPATGRLGRVIRSGLAVLVAAGAMVSTGFVGGSAVHGAGQRLTLGLPLLGGSSPLPSQSVASTIAGLREINYEPSLNGWQTMWLNWQPATIDADFGRIAGLHGNAVRLFVQPSAFGYPVPSTQRMQELSKAVALAAAHGLRSELSLFAESAPYGDIWGSEQWARRVVGWFAGDPRVYAIELKNEVDPHDSSAMFWARQLLPYVRGVDGGIPVTVSVCGCDNAANLGTLKQNLGSSQPDFFDFHFYGPPSSAPAAFQQAAGVAAPRPLFIGETGYSTSVDWAGYGAVATQAGREAYQDQFFRSVEVAAQQAGLPPAAPWTLSDIAISASPKEGGFGLYRLDGSAKPAAATIAAVFAGTMP
jgi:hypothetical protein